jgi:hypothetical protein
MSYIAGMRMVCVARHRILSEHFCRFFDALGVDTVPMRSLDEAMTLIQDEVRPQ